MLSIQNRLRELHDLLAAFLERPVDGALVVSCTDDEPLYLVHILEELDAESPADQIFIAPDPFIDQGSYLEAICLRISIELGIAHHDTSAAPSERLRSTIDTLLASLPAGDHRLVFALIPARIEDPVAFADLIEPLLGTNFPPLLRLVLREEPTRPLSAAAHSSPHILAFEFRLPASLVVEAIAETALDPSRPPDERAQALLQLAVRASGFGEHARALTALGLAADLAEAPEIQALVKALRADVLRNAGQLVPALNSAHEALRCAIAAESPPIIYQSAMTLGALTSEAGRPLEAVRCFELAERAALGNPPAQAAATEYLTAIQSQHPCRSPT